MKGIIFVSVLFVSGLLVLFSQESPVSGNSLIVRQDTSRIIYQHPKVFNLEISFEIKPDPLKIDRDQDLKVWIPIPREWDSQKNVQIVSVQPEPHSRYTDPEYGNHIFYWDFGKYPEKPSYRVDIKVRLISYQIRTKIDTSNIKPFDTTSVEYKLYTRSEHIINISPKVKELAKEAIGNETNPYLQAQKILTFVNMKIHWFQHMGDRSLDWLLSHPVIDESSGQEYYTGDCSHYSALFVAMCRSVGIPARSVDGRIGWAPFLNEDNSKTIFPQDTLVSDDGFAGAQHHGLGVHMWAEFYLQDIGWIPADANAGIFGRYFSFIIMSKGRDILLGPDAPQKDQMGYGFQWVPIHNGRVEELVSAVYNIQKIHKARSNVYHSLDPFPTDALLDYKYSSEGSNEALVKERMGFISQIDYCTRDIQNRDEEFSKFFDDPKWIK
jgi:hypothetical protein